MMTRSAQFYRLLSLSLVIGILLAVLTWAALMRSEVVRVENTIGQVKEVIQTDGRPVVRIGVEGVESGREVRLFLPFGRPEPDHGDEVRLVREYYDDGRERYRWASRSE